MKLNKFVEMTLDEVRRGVDQANTEARRVIVWVPSIVYFDVSLDNQGNVIDRTAFPGELKRVTFSVALSRRQI